MTAPAPIVAQGRKWFGLVLRHRRIARVLLRAGYADGAVFHAYHAYECVLSAYIAAKGFHVPPEGQTKIRDPSGKWIRVYSPPGEPIRELNAHKARIVFFNQLADHTEPHYAAHQQLSRILTYQDRLTSLYYDAPTDRLPYERYDASFARGLLSAVDQFARDVRSEIA